MKDAYNFSSVGESTKEMSLDSRELKTLEAVGLNAGDLKKLISGQHLAEGSYALIYDIPDKNPAMVAKAWKNPIKDRDRAQHENTALRLLRMQEWAGAPKVFGYLNSAGVLIEEKIDGEKIEIFDEHCIRLLARALSKIHSIRLNKYGKPLSHRKSGSQADNLSENINELTKKIGTNTTTSTDPTITDILKKALNKIKIESQEKNKHFQDANFTLVHFDLNKNNILLKKHTDEIIIIDWEQASAGDNAMDIAKMFLKLNFNQQQKECFLNEYRSNDTHLAERIKVYETIVLINSLLWRLTVLKNQPPQTTGPSEKEFYERVKNNFDKELNTLKNFVS